MSQLLMLVLLRNGIGGSSMSSSDSAAAGTPARQTIEAARMVSETDLLALPRHIRLSLRGQLQHVTDKLEQIECVDWIDLLRVIQDESLPPTPPSTGRPDEKCWLIEWPGKVVCWFTGERFSVNATDAKRFSVKAEAEQGIREMVSYGIARQCIATEHIFVGESPRERADDNGEPHMAQRAAHRTNGKPMSKADSAAAGTPARQTTTEEKNADTRVVGVPSDRPMGSTAASNEGIRVCHRCELNTQINNPEPYCDDFVWPTYYGEQMLDPDDPDPWCDICGHHQWEHPRQNAHPYIQRAARKNNWRDWVRWMLGLKAGEQIEATVRWECPRCLWVSFKAAEPTPPSTGPDLKERVHAALTAGFDGRGDFGGFPPPVSGEGTGTLTRYVADVYNHPSGYQGSTRCEVVLPADVDATLAAKNERIANLERQVAAKDGR